MKRFWSILLFIVFLLSLAGCGVLPTNPSPPSQNGESARIQLPAEAEADATAEGYPALPEDVVKSFLNTYQENPDQMVRYLSQNRVAKLPAGGALELLQFNGALSGFNIQVASVSPETSIASVLVEAKVGEGSVKREFVLVKEKDHWVIDAIRVPKK